MKLINRDTDYAMRALRYIVRHKNKLVSVSEIAKALKIPHAFLRKILQILQKEGILNSIEGRNGGFNLAVPAEKILLVDLIKIFQGPVQLADCLFKKMICPDAQRCLLKKKMDRLEHLVIAELKSITIASLSLHYQKEREVR